ncbi:MAG: hypothetical protein M3367_14775 [Acidobacteriota bacterium]|nr:hypothetical protein [Acidobacteriota bacterium]
MKNTFLKTFGTAAMTILLMSAMFTQISVSAQDIVKQDQSEAQIERESFPTRGGNPRAFEGT